MEDAPGSEPGGEIRVGSSPAVSIKETFPGRTKPLLLETVFLELELFYWKCQRPYSKDGKRLYPKPERQKLTVFNYKFLYLHIHPRLIQMIRHGTLCFLNRSK